MKNNNAKLESEIGKAVIRACEDGKSAEVKHDPKTVNTRLWGSTKKSQRRYPLLNRKLAKDQSGSKTYG